MNFAKPLLIFFAGMLAAATWHLYLSAQNLQLGVTNIGWPLVPYLSTLWVEFSREFQFAICLRWVIS